MATRAMPCDLEAEMSVLGVAFLSSDALEKINDEVTEDMFYNEKNRIIFNVGGDKGVYWSLLSV